MGGEVLLCSNYNLKKYLLWTRSLTYIIFLNPQHNPVNWSCFISTLQSNKLRFRMIRCFPKMVKITVSKKRCLNLCFFHLAIMLLQTVITDHGFHDSFVDLNLKYYGYLFKRTDFFRCLMCFLLYPLESLYLHYRLALKKRASNSL